MPHILEFTPSSSFEQLINSLQSENIIKIKGNKSIEILNRTKLDDFAFSIFVMLLFVSKRLGLTRISLLSFYNTETLILIEPYGHTSAFMHTEIPFSFIDNLRVIFQTGNKNHSLCDLKTSIYYNLSQFKGYPSFSTVFTPKVIKDINRVMMGVSSRKPCDKHANEILEFIKKRIKADANYGILLGGYPIFSKVPLNLYCNLLTGLSGRGEIIKQLLQIFDFSVTIDLAERNKSVSFISDSTLQTPFKSFEIDSAITKSSNGVDKLLVIETTTDYHDVQGSKNKIINFLSFKNSVSGGFKYIYLTLKTGKRAKHNRLIDIKHTCEVTGPVSWIMENEEDFVFLDLGRYKDLETHVKSAWWDIELLKDVFKYYMDSLHSISDSL